MDVDPADGSLRFSFQAGRRRTDIDDTIERLLELPAELAVERKRRVVLVFDEFQEIVGLDTRFPNLMRSVFQTQPEVGHVYLGSKRQILRADLQRSQRAVLAEREAARARADPGPCVRPVHPLPLRRRQPHDRRRSARAGCWPPRAASRTPPRSSRTSSGSSCRPGGDASVARVEEALANVIRSEYNHLSQLWDGATAPQRLVMIALAAEPTASIYAAAYRERHELPANPSLQRALGALIAKEIAGRDADGEYAVVEPFMADWLLSQRG